MNELRTIDVSPDLGGLLRWILQARPRLDEGGVDIATTLFWLANSFPWISAGNLLGVAEGRLELVEVEGEWVVRATAEEMSDV
tara:strand:+ start:278 stop:526 length:249 start_codon:yes stop_codon:yes gene_type:complete